MRDYNFEVLEKDLTGQWAMQAQMLGQPSEPEPTDEQLTYFDRTVAEFDLGERAVLLTANGSVRGIELPALIDVARGAALVNISGHLDHPRLFPTFRSRIFVDIDPGFTQFWHAAGNPGARVDGHDLFFTVGELIGSSACNVPTGGVRWRPVRQPVVLEDWPVVAPPRRDRFTTVASWRGPYGVIEHDGRHSTTRPSTTPMLWPPIQMSSPRNCTCTRPARPSALPCAAT